MWLGGKTVGSRGGKPRGRAAAAIQMFLRTRDLSEPRNDFQILKHLPRGGAITTTHRCSGKKLRVAHPSNTVRRSSRNRDIPLSVAGKRIDSYWGICYPTVDPRTHQGRFACLSIVSARSTQIGIHGEYPDC